jgi:hypothetical protein
MREPEGHLSEGDPVMVRDGVEHPELGNDIGGWQGWVTEIIFDETFGELVAVAWDSQTIAAMPQDHREEAEVAGIDFTRAILIPHELKRVAPRDEPGDALDVAATLDEPFDWDYLGKQGERIRQVISGTTTKREALQGWVGFLAQNLEFPFTAEVASYREQGPLQEGDVIDVRRISLVDDKHGVIVGVRFRNQQYDIPLFELEGLDELSANAQYVDDYAVWWDESEDHRLER